MNPGNRRIVEHQNFTVTHDDATKWWCIHNVKPTHAHASPGWWWNEHHNPITHDDDGNVWRHRKQPFCCNNGLVGRIEYASAPNVTLYQSPQIVPTYKSSLPQQPSIPPSAISLGKIQGVDYIFN